MILVVKDIMKVDTSNPKLIALGYEPKEEYGIPFRRFYKKKILSLGIILPRLLPFLAPIGRLGGAHL